MVDLVAWKNRKNRKPLVLRGARQVGKTWLVREFAKRHFTDFLEINFDDNPARGKLFKRGDIHSTLNLLEIETDHTIVPGDTLIFLDEIQAAPDVLPALRYFYEKRPDIHIICAGSLLEFLLEEHDFSMPVGRVEYLHLGPMDIEEFLSALGRERLVKDFLEKISPFDHIPRSIHDSLSHYLRLYWVIGGMPAAIAEYHASGALNEVAREHESILQTYEDDFAKYRKKIYPRRLRKVFRSIPALLGERLKYVKIDPDERAKDLADCLHLLQMARVIHMVRHSAGNGPPIGAEARNRNFKPLFLDIGLVATSLGVNLVSLEMADELLMVNKGAMAEQYIGQHLLYDRPGYERPELFYWDRPKKSSSAEVDYIICFNGRIVPIEVKAGKSGTLKSLQVFVGEKKSPVALRFNSEPPSCVKKTSSITGKDKHPYTFLSLPLYLVCQTRRMLQYVFPSPQSDDVVK